MIRAHISIVTPSEERENSSASLNDFSQEEALMELKELFELFDADKDGFISFLDLKNTLISLCEYESDHGVEEMMRKMLIGDLPRTNSFSVSREELRNTSVETKDPSVIPNADIRSQIIDFEKFAQTFLFYHINEESVEEDNEVLAGLTQSPTSASMSTQQFSSPNRVFVPVSNTTLSPSMMRRRSDINEKRDKMAASLARRHRHESLSKAYELAELIQDKVPTITSGEEDEDDDSVQDEQFVEQITLNEFENRQVFRVLDIDGNGSITIGELKDLILRYCSSDISDELDEDRLIDMLSVVDINSDGQVQYEEFLRLIELFEKNKRENRMKILDIKVVVSEVTETTE